MKAISFKSERIIALALLLFFATGQAHVWVRSAEPSSGVPGASLEMTAPLSMGILTTQGNNEITVNGTGTISGGTILSGASIETPAGVGATVSLAVRSSLEIEPKTKLTVQFDQSGVKVTLTEGCMNLRTKKGTIGEFSSANGSTGKSDPAQDGKLETCSRQSAAPIVTAEDGAGGWFRLGAAAAVTVIAEGSTAVAVPVVPRGVLY